MSDKKRMNGKVKMGIGVTVALLVGVGIGNSTDPEPETITVTDEEEVKALTAEIGDLEAEIESLESDLDGLNAEVDDLEQANADLAEANALLEEGPVAVPEVEEAADDMDIDALNRIAFQMTWEDNTPAQKAELCTGLSLLGPEATAVIVASDVPADDEDFSADIFVEEMGIACESEGLL